MSQAAYTGIGFGICIFIAIAWEAWVLYRNQMSISMFLAQGFKTPFGRVMLFILGLFMGHWIFPLDSTELFQSKLDDGNIPPVMSFTVPPRGTCMHESDLDQRGVGYKWRACCDATQVVR